MSIDFLKNIVFVSTIVFFIGVSRCFAWVGYDQNSGDKIEIGSGNLVREGETIEFYDWKNEEDRISEVRDIEYLFNGARLEVYDLVDDEVRIFDMED